MSERARKARLLQDCAAQAKRLVRLREIERLIERYVGRRSLGIVVAYAFGLQAALLMTLGIATLITLSSAIGDVGNLSGVIRQQRELLAARVAVMDAGGQIKSYALNPNTQGEQSARTAIAAAIEAIGSAHDDALNAEHRELLGKAKQIAEAGPTHFSALVKNENDIRQLVAERLHIDGPAIQRELDILASNATAANQIRTAEAARKAGAGYSQTRLAVERFLASSTKANIKAAVDQALALESDLNRIYETTSNAALLAETDRVIKRLISYDQSFRSLVSLSAQRDRSLHRLIDQASRFIAQIVGKTGGEIDEIQESAAINARVKLGGLLTISMILSLAGVVVVVAAARVFRQAVTKPIMQITTTMRDLTQGSLNEDRPDHEPDFTQRGDEIGDMARAIEIFRSNTVEMQRLQREEAIGVAAQQRADRAAREAMEAASLERQKEREEAARTRREMLLDLATRFENHVAKAMEAVSDAVLEIDEGARRVTSTVAQSRLIAATVADAAVETSTSTSSIATATEEMNLSLSEVSAQVLETSRFAARAVDRVGQTDEIVGLLARDAAEIGEVVSMVQSIAKKVNLLALNATIEASRAGEAGRGFAVVASEVKSLAQQTAAATAQIGERVGSIQRISQSAVEAINEIGSVIGEMGMLSARVASAVEQQSHTTAEIARNTTLAASGAGQVASNLRRVQDGVATSGDVAETARVAAEEVSRQTGALRLEIDAFLATVRAA